jgi:endothelin-converting enzyme/putative endopeptidase
MSRLRCFVLIVLPLSVVFGIAHQALAARQAPAGRTPSGVDLGAMDRSASPCTDFYQFACGGWRTSHPLPPDQPRYGRFNELNDRNQETLKRILEQAAAKPGGDPNMRKIGDYYGACMDEAAIEAKGTAPLEADLNAIASLKTTKELPALLARLHSMGTAAFFAFGAEQDFKDATEVIATADQGGLGLPDREYYLADDPGRTKLRTAYADHVQKMFALLGDAPPAASKAVVAIETTLATGSLDRVGRRNPANIYHRLSLEEVQKLTPSFDWSQYLRAARAPRVSAMNITVPEFFKTLDGVLTATPIEDVRTYLRWNHLRANASLLPVRFVDEGFAFYGRTLTGAQQIRPRWKRCVQYTDGDLGDAVGKAYVDETFGAEGKQQTLEMVRAIEQALERDIQTLDWMSEATKKQALVKLHAVTNKIGYPDRWRDYGTLEIVRGDALGNSQRSNTFEFRRQLARIGRPADKSEWGMTPPTVNAYYHPLQNNINFPAGILQPPFFDRGADFAKNFGAAGAVVGHELTHGFDDQGRQFDAQGNLRDWWTAEDGRQFEARAGCVVEQYAQYSAVGDVKLNGKLTLGENVADNGGLRLAYMALMARLGGSPGETMDGFTPEQRFFIGWGQIWCENATDQMARMLAQTDPHSPGRYRVNGVVSNMPEFAKAFSCKAGEPIVRQSACRVW